jgi:hypothetical protein
MSDEIYKVNKNIDRPLVFKGLKDQYIYYYLGVVVFSFFLFAILNSTGVGTLPTLLITGTIAMGGIKGVTIISDRFGKDGLKKYLAKRNIPKHLQVETRDYFIKINKDQGYEK